MRPRSVVPREARNGPSLGVGIGYLERLLGKSASSEDQFASRGVRIFNFNSPHGFGQLGACFV